MQYGKSFKSTFKNQNKSHTCSTHAWFLESKLRRLFGTLIISLFDCSQSGEQSLFFCSRAKQLSDEGLVFATNLKMPQRLTTEEKIDNVPKTVNNISTRLGHLEEKFTGFDKQLKKIDDKFNRRLTILKRI